MENRYNAESFSDRHKVEETVAAIMEARGSIDVLVNDAGVIQVAPFENLDLQDYRE